MAGKHKLDGLTRWSARERWSDRFDQVLQEHLIPACDQTGLAMDQVVSAIGKRLFMSVVWACAFEDFLTREFDGGENVVDDYLKRRGWKETATVRNYVTAIRHSTMSLYEVSDVVRGASFRARDLIRGGEPVLISERSATQSMKPWDRLAARVVQVGSTHQVCGGVLAFDHETAEAFLQALRNFDALGSEGRQQFAEANRREHDEAAFSALSTTERLRAITPMFTTYWLVDAIDRLEGRRMPELRNSDGDAFMLCEAHFPLTAGTTGAEISAALQKRPEFHPTSPTSWNWLGSSKSGATVTNSAEPAQDSPSQDIRSDDGVLVLGDLRLKDKALVLWVNSRQRSDRGCALLSEILGPRVGPPLINMETIEQIRASRRSEAPDRIDLSDEQHRAIVHDQLNRHYREVLEQPVPMLGGQTPREAIKTEAGRRNAADWLKYMENRTAKAAEPQTPVASYDFGWMWTELGLMELRR
jgi:hypothetical protein